MTDEERQTLVQRITEELAAVSEELATLEEKTKPIAPENAIGRVSRMDAIGNKMINEKSLASARARKAGLEMALASQNAADFGTCMVCMAPIPIERFLAIPEAALCMRCAAR